MMSLSAIIRWTFLSYIALLFLMTGCGDEGPLNIIVNKEGISVVAMDSLFVYQTDRYRQIAIRVKPRQLARDRTLFCVIRSPRGGLIHYRLYDDGNFGRWDDSPGFADSLSGDSVPDDGVFSRRINSKFGARKGSFEFAFALSGLPPPDTLRITVTVRENSPPVVVSVQGPDSVQSGGNLGEFIAEIHDPDGWDDIFNVDLIIFDQEEYRNRKTFLMENSNDTVWTWKTESEISAGYSTGIYSLTVQVQDYVMSNSRDWIRGDTLELWLENLPPEVIDVAGEDTIRVPRLSGDRVFFDYTISVADDQGFSDLDSLYLKLLKDTVIAGVDAEIVKLEKGYFDGVGYPDTIALDGRFHAGFSADSSNHVPASFTFEWTPADRSGNMGPTFKSRLIFMPMLESFLKPGDDNIEKKPDDQNFVKIH